MENTTLESETCDTGVPDSIEHTAAGSYTFELRGSVRGQPTWQSSQDHPISSAGSHHERLDGHWIPYPGCFVPGSLTGRNEYFKSEVEYEKFQEGDMNLTVDCTPYEPSISDSGNGPFPQPLDPQPMVAIQNYDSIDPTSEHSTRQGNAFEITLGTQTRLQRPSTLQTRGHNGDQNFHSNNFALHSFMTSHDNPSGRLVCLPESGMSFVESPNPTPHSRVINHMTHRTETYETIVHKRHDMKSTGETHGLNANDHYSSGYPLGQTSVDLHLGVRYRDTVSPSPATSPFIPQDDMPSGIFLKESDQLEQIPRRSMMNSFENRRSPYPVVPQSSSESASWTNTSLGCLPHEGQGYGISLNHPKASQPGDLGSNSSWSLLGSSVDDRLWANHLPTSGFHEGMGGSQESDSMHNYYYSNHSLDASGASSAVLAEGYSTIPRSQSNPDTPCLDNSVVRSYIGLPTLSGIWNVSSTPWKLNLVLGMVRYKCLPIISRF